MPELPEVETVKRGLEKLIVGQRITSVDFDWPKSFPNPNQDVKKFVINSVVESVNRRAKVLIINLSTGYSLVVHLKMTGQMVFRGEQRFGAGHPTESMIGKLPDKSTRVTFVFKSGAKLFFNDQRKFGWVRLIPTPEIPNIDFMKKLGPEPLEESFTAEIFTNQLRKRPRTNIKAALLDQTVIAGVGNIYADEALWGAKIHPQTTVMNISEDKRTLLLKELKYVFRLSIEKGGSTDRNYVNAEGKKGSYMQFARVFRREGLACPRCGATIVKLRVAGRGTHVCPSCQKVSQK